MKPTQILDMRSVRILQLGVGALVLANILNHVLGEPFWTLTRLIDLGSDRNASAWYSSVLMLIAACAALQCNHVARDHQRLGRNAFLVLALLLAFMSCDEIARFHEILGHLVADRVGVAEKQFAQHSKWVWVLGPVVILVFAVTVAALRSTLAQVPGATRPVVMGFVALVVGGIFLESTINFLDHDHLQEVWVVEIWVEESMEMLGSLSILSGLVLWRNGAGVAAIAP